MKISEESTLSSISNINLTIIRCRNPRTPALVYRMSTIFHNGVSCQDIVIISVLLEYLVHALKHSSNALSLLTDVVGDRFEY
jgi:hypothetical protein